MRKIQRLASAGAIVALVVTMSACGAAEAPSTTTANPAPAAPTASAAARADGVTTASDTFGAACSQLPQGRAPGSLESMGPQPVASAASTNPLLTSLVSAVKAAGLVDVLNAQKSSTVFAPYDPAFDEMKKSMGEARYDALLGNKEILGNVLKYHVVPRRFDKDGLLAEQSGVATLAGGTLQLKMNGDTLTVTDGAGQTANVLCGNIPTKNATVFVIDKLLMGTKSY